ncbi:MAG: hypothetical protein HY790_05485 [Deltaproteobacteria bacterium]|nr:hypothetical protein [Deltaproteobacteria bacterium]
MNTFTGVMLLLWMGGWTLAMVRAGLKARAVAIDPLSGKKLPRKSAIVTG